MELVIRMNSSDIKGEHPPPIDLGYLHMTQLHYLGLLHLLINNLILIIMSLSRLRAKPKCIVPPLHAQGANTATNRVKGNQVHRRMYRADDSEASARGTQECLF